MSSLWRHRDRIEMNEDTTIDEVVIDGWLHIEAMDRHNGTGKRYWWVRLGDREFDIESTRNGYAVHPRPEGF